MNILKLWWKQLFCEHKWEYGYWKYNIKICLKCGKVESL